MKRIFLNGLIVVVPILLTLALLAWLLEKVEGFFGYLIQHLFGPKYYFPGLGILMGLVLVFVVGIFMKAWTVKKLHAKGEQWLQRIPLIKTLYGSLRDLMSFFSDGKRKAGKKVVRVIWGECACIGLVTREEFDHLPCGLAEEGEIAVYVPMSYQLGGFTLLVKRNQVVPLDMTVEQAMRFAVTAGMTINTDSKK